MRPAERHHHQQGHQIFGGRDASSERTEQVERQNRDRHEPRAAGCKPAVPRAVPQQLLGRRRDGDGRSWGKGGHDSPVKYHERPHRSSLRPTKCCRAGPRAGRRTWITTRSSAQAPSLAPAQAVHPEACSNGDRHDWRLLAVPRGQLATIPRSAPERFCRAQPHNQRVSRPISPIAAASLSGAQWHHALPDPT